MPTSTEAVAQGIVRLCKEGKFNEAIAEYYSDDIVSIEPHGENPESHGIEAVRAKTEWWAQNFEFHGVEVTGPFVNGDQFAVVFDVDTTEKASGNRSRMDEIAVYVVKDGKIIHERFFNKAG